MKSLIALAVLALSLAPATAADFHIVTDMVLAPAETCDANRAQGVMVRTGNIKPAIQLPDTADAIRFLGVSYQTGAWVGASVAKVGCGLTVVSDVGSRRPWCSYLPTPCPDIVVKTPGVLSRN